MNPNEASQILVTHIKGLDGFHYTDEYSSTYGHMGAIICDAILQAGMNYLTVVAPRVDHLLMEFPDCTTTSGFVTILNQHGPGKILQWKHHEKPRRVRMLAEHFLMCEVEEEDDLVNWLVVPENCVSLMELKGIGPKTVDYLKLLVNLPAIAVDRHIRKFVYWAGVRLRSYADIRLVVSMTADILEVPHRNLDHAIWEYVVDSNSNN